ncbi:MAG: DUF4332 domain-containing protein [Leptospirales bacterium]|nr:DUF4332 domain-containing protein [Leptospirales bacterium]
MAKLEDIEGIGPVYAEKLKAAGVASTDDLLAQGKTRAGRDKIAAASGITLTLVLKWINHVDLARVNGIGWEFAELLEAAGVDTVPELAQRNAGALATALSSKNEEKKLTRRTPGEDQVKDWIAQAKALPRAIEY